MGVKSRNRRRAKARDLVVDISGTGFAGPEQHSTAVLAWESPCEEKEKRSVLGTLVSALLRPCCGSSRDVVAPRSKTKVKRIKQCKTAKDCKRKLETADVDQPSPQCINDSSSTQPGPSIALTHADSGYASSSLLFPTPSEAQDINAVDDNLSIIGLGELSERAQEEQDSRQSNDTPDNSSSRSDPATSSEQANIPGVPDCLTVRQSNKVKLSPIQPLYLSKAMKNMKRALAKTEEEEKVPPIVPFKLRKPQPLSKKQKQLHDKLVARLMKHTAQCERQMMKAKLADKKKAIKEEFEKVTHMKKRAKIDKKLEKVWETVDKQPSKTREQTLQENDAAIEKHNAVIQRLKHEIEMLKGKQECKLMRHELVRNKGYKSILSETVQQCEATKLRHRYFSLGREVDKLWDEVNSRERKVQELVPNSSCSVSGINTENEDQSVQQGDSNITPPTKVVLVRSSGSEDEDANVGVSVPQLSEEESAIEEDPFVRYGFAPPVHERKPENTALVALFIGNSAGKPQHNENDGLKRFQAVVGESVEDNTSTDSYSIDSSLESQSLSSFEFEECSETDEVASEPSPTPDPPVFRNTSMVSPHLLLPAAARHYTVKEQTEQDLEA